MLESTREAGRPIDINRLNAVEAQMGVEFPESYRRFLPAYNGGRPTPCNLFPVIDGRVTWMRIHFFFGIDHGTSSCDLGWNFSMYKGRVPINAIPIANDEAGNRFCLDLRGSTIAPVLLWDHESENAGPESAVRVIAASFEDLLLQLTHHA